MDENTEVKEEPKKKAAPNEKENPEKPSKKSVIEKEVLKFTVEWKTQIPLTPKEKLGIKAVLKKMDAEDHARRLREEARNGLEAYLYSTRELLYESDFESVSVPEEREKLKALLDETSEWMEDHAETAITSDLESKLGALKKIREPIDIRRREASLRPVAVEALESSLQSSRAFLASALAKQSVPKKEEVPVEGKAELGDQDETKKKSEDKVKEELPVFPPEALVAFEKLLNKTSEWFLDLKERQEKTQPYQDPILLSSDCQTKRDVLEESMTRVKSMERVLPKPKKSTKSSKTKKSAGDAKATVVPTEADGETQGRAQGSAQEDADKETKENVKKEDKESKDDNVHEDL